MLCAASKDHLTEEESMKAQRLNRDRIILRRRKERPWTMMKDFSGMQFAQAKIEMQRNTVNALVAFWSWTRKQLVLFYDLVNLKKKKEGKRFSKEKDGSSAKKKKRKDQQPGSRIPFLTSFNTLRGHLYSFSRWKKIMKLDFEKCGTSVALVSTA